MGGREMEDNQEVQAAEAQCTPIPAVPREDALQPLLAARTLTPKTEPLPSVVMGELIALIDGGFTPLVLYGGQPGTAVLRARTVVDLHGTHIGHQVALMFENGDPAHPIIMGVMRQATSGLQPQSAGQVEVDTDGERMQVSAKEQLVLRCGKASITLTKAGKVLVQGTYVSSHSTGVNRLKGGSVQLN